MPTILAFIAHPDDESYSFAGTLARLARRGWRAVVISATAGEGGERHDGGSGGPEALASARKAELAESCRTLGLDPPVCWDLPDGQLLTLEPQVDRVLAALREYQPDIVFSLGPDGAYGHPDHLAVVDWVMAAAEAAGETAPPVLYTVYLPGLFVAQYERCLAAGVMGDPPLLAPGQLGQTWADLMVDIRPVWESKLAAIAAHRTQLPGGDPRALFPEGIVDELLISEPFSIAGSPDDERVATLREVLAAET